MKLRTKKIEQWITVNGDGEDEKAEILVKPLTPKETSEMLDKCKKVEWDRGQRFTEIDFFKFKLKKIFAVIIDWKGIQDEEGNELRCISANKEIVYLNNPELIDDILEKADALYKGLQEDLEKESKNLKTAQPGMVTNQ